MFRQVLPPNFDRRRVSGSGCQYTCTAASLQELAVTETTLASAALVEIGAVLVHDQLSLKTETVLVDCCMSTEGGGSTVAISS